MTSGRSDGGPTWGWHADTRIPSASQAAKVMIAELIESELRPGQRLNADDLGHRLGVSRTPVRDALHQLQREGLVEVQPRRGFFVRDVSVQEVDEVYALKAAVEPIAARWATERGSEDAKQELARLSEQLIKTGSGDRNVHQAADCVDQIHNLLFEMADSSVLRDVYNVIHGRVKWLRSLNMAQAGRLETSLQQHEKIVTLVLAGDASGAEATMTAHMRDAASSVRNVVR